MALIRNQPNLIQTLLGIRKDKLSRLCHKHHPAIHHQATRGTYLTDITKLIELRNRQKVSDKTITYLSKGVLDSSGSLPEAAGDYKKALEARKILSASASHVVQRPRVLAAQQLTQQSRQRVLTAMCTLYCS